MRKYVMINSLEGVINCVKENEASLKNKIALVSFVTSVGLGAVYLHNKSQDSKIERLKKEIEELKKERG